MGRPFCEPLSVLLLHGLDPLLVDWIGGNPALELLLDLLFNFVARVHGQSDTDGSKLLEVCDCGPGCTSEEGHPVTGQTATAHLHMLTEPVVEEDFAVAVRPIKHNREEVLSKFGLDILSEVHQ